MKPLGRVMGDLPDKQTSSLSNGETSTRSFAKAISWRFVGTIDTFLLSFVVIKYLGPYFGMGSSQDNAQIVTAASAIAIAEIITKIILYIVHERVWNKLRWGLVIQNSSQAESHRRTAIKTTTWRVLASLDTMFLAFVFTGSPATAVSIGSFEIITKLGLYYAHERVWQKVTFGLQFSIKN